MITVILNDTGISYDRVYEHFSAADTWARAHCSSYRTYESTDISDVSLSNDVVATYTFDNEQDATLFRLRWL